IPGDGPARRPDLLPDQRSLHALRPPGARGAARRILRPRARRRAGGETGGPPLTRPIRVLHVITRMIVGGAQENTMLSCALIDRERFPSTIVCGPETGAEGSLHDECRARGVPVVIEPDLVRSPHPVRDMRVIGRLARRIRDGEFDVVHTHTS